jgi:hypothetical protein
MWALILFTVFANTQAGAWDIHRGTSSVISGFTSKEACESAGREFKTDKLATGWPSWEERQKIRLKHRFQCVEIK